MKEKIQTKTKEFALKRPKIALAITVAIVVAAGYAVYAHFVRAILPPYDLYTVISTDLVEQVMESGVVTPSERVDLAFSKSAKIAGVYAKEGDFVYKGAVLVNLENADVVSSLALSQANLRAEQARLSTLRAGTPSVNMEANQSAVNSANKVLNDRIRGAQSAIDDVLRNQTLSFFRDPRNVNSDFVFTIANSSLQIEIGEKRKDIEAALTSWKTFLDVLNDAKDPISSGGASIAEQNLKLVSSYLDSLSDALAQALPNANVTPATLSGYRASVALSRTNINMASSALLAAEQSAINANSILHIAQAGAQPSDIEAEEARVDGVQASVNSMKVELGKTYLVAPFSGVITRVDAKIGAIAGMNEPLVSLISQGGNQIELYVSQIDIEKLEPGQDAVVSLDAYGATVPFNATIVSVNPGNTPQNGAASYKVTLHFKSNDPRIKEGMGANAIIETSSKQGVLAVPKSSILTKKSEHYVMVETLDGLVEQKVETGIVGNNDLIEVISGINVGDRVASFGK